MLTLTEYADPVNVAALGESVALSTPVEAFNVAVFVPPAPSNVRFSGPAVSASFPPWPKTRI